MNKIINYIPFGWANSPTSLPAGSPPPAHEALKIDVNKIICLKQKQVEKTLNDTKARYHPITGSDTIIIFGDIFNTGFLIFEALKNIFPFFAKIGAITVLGSVFGIIAGITNIGEGMVCFKEGFQALSNKDYKKGARLVFDGVFCTLIGAVMIVLSIAQHIAFLGGISAFFTSNPWILPVLMFVVAVPLLAEVFNNNQQIWRKIDLPSTFKLDQVRKAIKHGDFDEVKKLWEKTELDLDGIVQEHTKAGLKSLSERMEVLQANMGPRCAVEAFRLFQAVLEKDEKNALKSLKDLRLQVRIWNGGQMLRLLVQTLFTTSFIVSMIALKPGINKRWIEAGQNIFLTFACAIPTYIDTFLPFVRDTTLIVPKVDTQIAN